MEDKQAAFDFLTAFHDRLRSQLPGPAEMSQRIAEIVQASVAPESDHHKGFPEGAFLNHFVLPELHGFLSDQPAMDAKKAKHSILSESYRSEQTLASWTPASAGRHPFTKVVGSKPVAIVNQWRGHGRGRSVVQACPDLALRRPSPHKVVFEGKYFAKGRATAAETALVSGIYQAFFYRALPRMPEIPAHAAWDYDYACFLAYDATEDGTLSQAWRSLDLDVRRGCWEGANVYVMILGHGD
jgi:hypothetical protein